MTTSKEYTFSATPAPSPEQPAKSPPEQLARVKFVPPETIELEFADSFRASLAIELLEMPMDRILWSSVEAGPVGDVMLVTAIKGEIIPIDSSVVRYLVDPQYAAMMDAKLQTTQFTEEEAKRIFNKPPPAEWLSDPPKDLTLDSWK